MNIVADEQIAFVREAFSRIGKVRAVPPGAITARAVRHADILLIRSVTKVTDALLRGSRIRIIGTTTSGIDHVDTVLLRERGIKLISAPGCNARAVAEYVLASLVSIADEKGFKLHGKTIGIIGVGHVGSLVARFCRTMGMKLVLNDPPLAARSGNKDQWHRPIADVLKHSDIITLHASLTDTGRYATRHMVNDEFFARLKKNVILINTSRGAVIDETALLKARRTGKIGALVLDVWEHEPGISSAVLEIADIGTSHIAGHSFLGRLRGTAMVYDRLSRILGRKNPGGWSSLRLAQAGRNKTVSVSCVEKTDEEAIRQIVNKFYNPNKDDYKLRRYLELPRSAQPLYFKRVRESYKLRPEFGEITVRCRFCSKGLLEKITALGFQH